MLHSAFFQALLELVISIPEHEKLAKEMENTPKWFLNFSMLEKCLKFLVLEILILLYV